VRVVPDFDGRPSSLPVLPLAGARLVLPSLHPRHRRRRSDPAEVLHGAVVNVVSLGALAAVPVLPAYSVSKAASLSVTQSLRALLAGRGVSVHAVLPSPIDTDMVRALEIPKTPPENVARATLDGVELGEEEIFPDPMSQSLANAWRAGVAKELERQNAAMVQAEPIDA
jgi:short-subunit dehydrogenase